MRKPHLGRVLWLVGILLFSGCGSKKAEWYFSRGKKALDSHDNKKAVELLSEGIHRDKHYVYAYMLRGNAYAEIGRWKEALADFDRYIVLRPRDAEGYSNRGYVYIEMGKGEKGLADVEKALSINTNDPTAYYAKAVWHDKKEEYDKALENYDRVIKLYPLYPGTYHHRAVIHHKKERFDKAIENLETACRLNFEPSCKYLKKFIK